MTRYVTSNSVQIVCYTSCLSTCHMPHAAFPHADCLVAPTSLSTCSSPKMGIYDRERIEHRTKSTYLSLSVWLCACRCVCACMCVCKLHVSYGVWQVLWLLAKWKMQRTTKKAIGKFMLYLWWRPKCLSLCPLPIESVCPWHCRGVKRVNEYIRIYVVYI